MSLKTELEDRGVKLSVLAKELEEAYGNLYTALSLEDKGQEVRHKAVTARLDKVREWLDHSATAEARVEAAAAASGDTALLRKRWGSCPVPAGWTVELDFAGIHCGDVVTVRTEEGPTRWRILRKVTNAVGSTWVDAYGGTGDAKTGTRLTRSFRPEALGLS